MKRISSLLAAIALLCGAGMANGQESERFKATKIKAEQGNAEVQIKLGDMYLEGEGVPLNYVEAAKWFRKAAEQGHAEAQLNLGWMYDGGHGVPLNYVEAAKWIRKAAEQGIARAQHNLGVMYHVGEGVPQDYEEAYAWLFLAKAKGFGESRKLVSHYEKVFTAEQKEKGQARALDLHRSIGAE